MTSMGNGRVRVTSKALRATERPKPRRFTDDGGAVLVEAALITPVFVYMLFGIIEFGGAFRDYLTVTNMVTAGSREEAIQGLSLQADWETLQAIRKAGRAMPSGQIERIVVWKAEDRTDPVPGGCRAGSPTFNGGTFDAPAVGACNVYSADDMRDEANGPNWTCTVGPNQGPIRYYCPSGRKVSVAATPDYLGIYIQVRHPWVTGLFGEEITLSDQSVTKLEPQTIA